MKVHHVSLLLVINAVIITSMLGNNPALLTEDEERDFLFLGAEEPDMMEEGDEAVLQNDAEIKKEKEEQIIVSTKQKNAKRSRGDTTKDTIVGKEDVVTLIPVVKPSPFTVHEKEEDVVYPPVVTQQDLKKMMEDPQILGVGPFFSLKKIDGEFILSGRYRPETFVGKNLAFLNDCNDLDRVFFIRHTIDITGDAFYGKKRYGHDAAELKFTLRNKGVWGNPASIAPTTETSVRDIDATFGAHRHHIGRHVIWVRELWLKTSINAVLGVENEKKHYFVVGFYPFKLGHGIALGDAYAVNPGLLGFFSDNVIDQYAPGMLLTGEIIKDRLEYDVYAAIFENKSDSISNNSEPIYAQKFGCTQPFDKGRNKPERGFGHVNWLIAGRFQSVAFDSEFMGKLEIEPYILYNQAPEQKIEFTADAESKLGTFGADFDYTRGDFEASFEFAKNFGRQVVHGWDRNQIITKLDPVTAAVLHVDSKVIDTVTATNALDIAANQAAINSSPQGEDQNGQLIPGTLLRNSADRFSNPYKNEYKGWMVFFDAGYWFLDHQVQIAVTAGAASGDENPNSSFEDPKAAPVCSTPEHPGKHDFEGFVGLQEIFNGERVESAYVLGQRRLIRPLSLPNDAIEQGFFAATVSEFTNIVFAGVGLHVKPNWKNKFYWRPNILCFWQEEPTRAFDLATKKVSTTRNARNYLGTELNTFIDIYPLPSLKAFFVLSLFIPGAHFKDIKGEPVNKDQVKILQELDDDDVVPAGLPLLGTDRAVSFNFGLEYRY